MSQRELGNRLDLKDAAIGKAIDAMEKVGVLERRADSQDRRKALVYLTKSGKLLAKKVATRRQKFLDALVDGFSEQEVGQFTGFLERCYINIRSEEHTSELQSLMRNSYAVSCLQKKSNK